VGANPLEIHAYPAFFEANKGDILTMNKLSKITAVTAASGAVALAGVTPAFAASPGQLQSGNLTYVVKNVSQNGSYANAVSAKPCEEVRFSVRLHNTEFGNLNNIVVKANLGSGSSIVSNMTATPDAGASAGTSGSVAINLSSPQVLTFESGSAALYDANGSVIQNLNGDITQGINVGTVKGSTTEFVNFNAKVSCPTPVTPETPVTPQPTQLPQTGAEAGLAGMAGTGALGYAVMQYRRSRKALADKLLNRK
jgi:hypothetical protein